MDDIVRILQNIQEEQKQDIKVMEQNIKESINNNINQKFNYIKNLEEIIEKQQTCIESLDKQLRRRNVIFFGIEEEEKGYESLLSIVLAIINNNMGVPCQKWEIESVYKMGKNNGKARPVVVTITTASRKIDILKKKKSLINSNMYLKEDFSPSVLQKRKDLQDTLKRERESGKRVVLRYHKIVTLKTLESESRNPTGRNSSKRFLSTSLEETEKQTTKQSNYGGMNLILKKNKPQDITRFSD
ncbi:unnamed protein product [Leptidea sinapis]|uniref:Endonuclease-reverse transcriptase n=1 Tax=Leptidea sinapis TaxID=189913 RepID=A0A5E4QD70_9NEOP|nr:unnamed protein product [Leptidea sinapis]